MQVEAEQKHSSIIDVTYYINDLLYCSNYCTKTSMQVGDQWGGERQSSTQFLSHTMTHFMDMIKVKVSGVILKSASNYNFHST